MRQILLAGDSTVTEQPRSTPYAPGCSYCGWGQMLHLFCVEGTAIHNYAISGLTVETFRDEGQYDKLRATLRPGDFALFQFGHNDQKRAHLQAEGGYREGLTAYVSEIREAGGIPVLVTPVARNSWKGNGAYNDLLAEYAAAVLRLGSALDVPVLDLHARSMDWIRALGLQGAKAYFYPGDFTHANVYGGFVWARMLMREIAACEHLTIDPLREMLLDAKDWPEMDVPEGKAHPVYGWLYPPALRCDLAAFRDIAELTCAGALEMASQAYGFFAINGEEGSAELVAAKQNGYLPDGFPEEEALETPISVEDFCALMRGAALARTPLPSVIAEVPRPQPPLTGAKAVEYALALETALHGHAAPMKESGNRPEGA